MKMKNPPAFHHWSAIMAVAAASTCQVMAVGYRLPNQDPEAIARGNAFVATADDPAAIYYNPAGITQLEGNNVSTGVYLISTNIDYRSLTGSPAGTDTRFQAVPQIYYVYSPAASPWSYGLGLYAPYGLGIDYGTNTTFSTIALKGKLAYLCLNPVVAYQLSPTFSLAAGLTVNYSDVNLLRRITGPSDVFQFDGDGYDLGANLGLLWHPVSEWSFGLNFRSSTKIEYKGESIASPYTGGAYLPTSASMKYPMYVVGGVSYRPNDDWNFEFNLDWTEWDQVNDSQFIGTFGGNQAFRFRYDSSFMYEFGVTRKLGNGYFVSAGYIYSENSVPNATFSPLNPDANLHLGSVGFGHRGEAWGWALGYHFAYNGGRRVTGSGVNPMSGETADGDYKVFNHAVNVSFRYSF